MAICFEEKILKCKLYKSFYFKIGNDEIICKIYYKSEYLYKNTEDYRLKVFINGCSELSPGIYDNPRKAILKIQELKKHGIKQ